MCDVGKTRDIREAVESELGYAPRVDGGGITVKNMNGEVALNGTVPSYPQYLKAEAAARGVAGVINVHNHLKVVLPPEDYQDDPLLTTAANNALAASLAVPDGVEATAENGNLTLTGMVDYRRQRAAAESAVTGLTGVRNVNNEIAVLYDTDPADVCWHIRQALDRCAVFSDEIEVKVDVSGNTVMLTGHVRTRAEHAAVVDAAWMAQGAMAVIDELQITT
jgi:osmotically-inducible protein OsmY